MSDKYNGNIYVRNLNPSMTDARLYEIFNKFGKIFSCKIVYDEYGKSKNYGFVNFDNLNDAQNAIDELNGTIVDGEKLFINHHVSRKDRLGNSNSNNNPNLNLNNRQNLYHFNQNVGYHYHQQNDNYHRRYNSNDESNNEEENENENENFTNLYIKNIGLSITEDDFEKLFSKFGEIDSLYFLIDQNKKSKGVAFVNFKNHDDALKAIEKLHNSNFKNSILSVSKSQKKFDKNNNTNNNSKKFDHDQDTISEPGVDHHRHNTIGPHFGSVPLQQSLSYNGPNVMGGIHHPPILDPNFINPHHASHIHGIGFPKNIPKFQNSNLYIKNIPYEYTDDDLIDLFKKHGPIVSSKIMTDEKGYSKCFGFVCFENISDAINAMKDLNDARVGDQQIHVSFAQKKDYFFNNNNTNYNVNSNNNNQRSNSNPNANINPNTQANVRSLGFNQFQYVNPNPINHIPPHINDHPSENINVGPGIPAPIPPNQPQPPLYYPMTYPYVPGTGPINPVNMPQQQQQQQQTQGPPAGYMPIPMRIPNQPPIGQPPNPNNSMISLTPQYYYGVPPAQMYYNIPPGNIPGNIPGTIFNAYNNPKIRHNNKIRKQQQQQQQQQQRGQYHDNSNFTYGYEFNNQRHYSNSNSSYGGYDYAPTNISGGNQSSTENTVTEENINDYNTLNYNDININKHNDYNSQLSNLITIISVTNDDKERRRLIIEHLKPWIYKHENYSSLKDELNHLNSISNPNSNNNENDNDNDNEIENEIENENNITEDSLYEQVVERLLEYGTNVTNISSEIEEKEAEVQLVESWTKDENSMVEQIGQAIDDTKNVFLDVWKNE